MGEAQQVISGHTQGHSDLAQLIWFDMSPPAVLESAEIIRLPPNQSGKVATSEVQFHAEVSYPLPDALLCRHVSFLSQTSLKKIYSIACFLSNMLDRLMYWRYI